MFEWKKEKKSVTTAKEKKAGILQRKFISDIGVMK